MKVGFKQLLHARAALYQLVQLRQLAFGQGAPVCCRRHRGRESGKERTGLGHCEARSEGKLDDPQATQVLRRVPTLAPAPEGFGQEALRFVIADGGRRKAGSARQRSDRHVRHIYLQQLKVLDFKCTLSRSLP